MKERNAEMEARDSEPQDKMDRLLRRTLAAPIPSLSAKFDRQLQATLRRDARPLDRARRFLLVGYGITASLASAVVMHGQGLNWGVTAGAIFASLLLLPAAALMRSATHASISGSIR